MVWRTAQAETLRLVTRPRMWALVAAVGAYGAAASLAERDAVARGAGVQPTVALGAAVGLQVLWLLVLALPLVAGGSFGRDRDAGYLRLLYARGLTPTLAVIARLLAALEVAAFAVAVVACTIVAAAVARESGAIRDLGSAVSFAPQLLGRSLVAWVALVSAVYALATATVLGISTLLGVFTSELAAQTVPPLLMLILGFVFVGPLWPLNPLERASFLQIHGVEWAVSPVQMTLYWLSGLTLIAGLAIMAVRARRGIW